MEKHSEAFELLQKAHRLDPNSPKVLRPYILEGSFAGKSADVQDAAEQLAANSDEPQDLYIVAGVLIKNLRQDEAVPLLEKYVAAVPGNAPAWVGLGLGYEDLKRFDDAQKAFENALRADPKFAEAEYQLGLLISTTGNSALATQHYEHAIELNPGHTLALEKLGGLYLQSGQFEKARDVLLKSEALDPKNRQIQYGLALVYGKLGNREEAKIHMERFEKYGQTGSAEKK
jgi:tetratricopeptide (TPR) repeat protein